MRLQIIILVIVATCISSCKSKKNILEPSVVNKNWNIHSALSEVLNNEIQYTNITAKGHLEAASGRRISSVYKIIKDSIIHISLRAPLIGEVFTVHFTPQSVTLVDRLKGQYSSQDYSEFAFMNSLNFNFYNLQALLTNRLFIPGKNQITENDQSLLKISKAEDLLTIKSVEKKNISSSFVIDSTEHIISVFLKHSDISSFLLFSYSDFVNDDSLTYPSRIDISLSTPNRNLAMTINYSSVEFDKKDIKADLSIPTRYKKVKLKNLLQPYLNLK